MINIRYNKNDLRYIFLYGDPKEMKQLEEFLNKIPQYCFMPSFKGIPKPEVFLFKFKKNDQTIYYTFSGLWKQVIDWCNSKGIAHDDMDSYFKYTDLNISKQDFHKYVESWGLNLNPYDYQIDAAWLILKFRQSLSQLATRAGKTLIAYIVFRYMIEHGAHNVLMIVPNTNLIKQAVNDMKDYKEFFQSETVWADGELCSTSNLTIGTFQSLVRRCDRKNKKYDPHFFDKFDVVCCDEAHTSKCKSIKTILSQDFMKHVKVKFGFSGSLPDENTIDSFATQSLLGPMIQDIRSKELMNQGFITPVDITQVRINYQWTDELKKSYIQCGEYLNGIPIVENYINKKGKLDKRHVLLPKEERCFTMIEKKTLPLSLTEVRPLYDDDEYIKYLVDLCAARGSNLLLLEQMLVHRSKKRLDLIDELIMGFDKNCVVFGHHSEYLRYLTEHFKKRFPDRPVYLIQGETSTKKREKIIARLLTDKNAILVASYGCAGTGLTLKNLDYGILAQSFKSSIINKQTIGRGLCLANDKDKYRLYDLIDVFPTKKLYAQGLAKVRLYAKEQFDYRIINK